MNTKQRNGGDIRRHDIDNTLVEQSDDANRRFLVNHKNAFSVLFAKDSQSDRLVSVIRDEYLLSFYGTKQR